MVRIIINIGRCRLITEIEKWGKRKCLLQSPILKMHQFLAKIQQMEFKNLTNSMVKNLQRSRTAYQEGHCYFFLKNVLLPWIRKIRKRKKENYTQIRQQWRVIWIPVNLISSIYQIQNKSLLKIFKIGQQISKLEWNLLWNNRQQFRVNLYNFMFKLISIS